LNFHISETETSDDYIKPLKGIVDRIRFELFITHIDPDHISFQRVPELQKIVSQSIKVYLGKYKDTPKDIIDLLQKIDKKLLTNKPRGLKTLVNALDKATKSAAKENTVRKVKLDVREGKLNVGTLGKAQFKSGGGDYNFIYRTWEDFGPVAAKDLVTKVQKTMDYWLVGHGHTIGMGDMLVKEADVRSEITLSVVKGLEAYKKLEMDTVHENLIPGIGKTVEDEFETQSMQIFNDVFNSKIPAIITEYLKNTPNNMHNMVTSGAKGNIINETQIMGVVGPIAIGGKRFPKTYGNRSLPHYQKYSNNATSRGFAANSFVDGLSPQEFFISMASGREGCIDTAIKTAQSGYISRRLMKAMEDYMANYDTSVRNSMGRIIQFIYAGSGLDPVYCTHTQLRFINCSYSEMNKNYLYTDDDLNSSLHPKVYKAMKDNKNMLKEEYNIMVYYQKLLREYIYRDYTESDVTFMSPINLEIELLNVKTNFDITNHKTKSLLDPIYVAKKINGLCSIIPKLYTNTSFNVSKNIPLVSEYNWPRQNLGDPFDVNAFFKHLHDNNSEYYPVTILFCIYVRSYLSSKQSIMRHHLTKEAFDYLIDQIIYKYIRAIIAPGEMVGSLAAQSIGEPTTQATLNSVDYKEKIIIGKKIGTKNGKMILDIKEIPIGRFVEKCLKYLKDKDIDKSNNDKFKYFNYRNERRDHAEYGEIENLRFYAISTDKNGKLNWNNITGVSKHLPINEDGSDTLIKITLNNRLCLTATRGHSFLVKSVDGLIRKEGKTLKIGDYIPVMKDFPIKDIHELEYLDLSKYLPKNEYIWGSEMAKAQQIMEDYNSRGNRHWFSCNNGKLFTIPYSRSDIAREAFYSKKYSYNVGKIYIQRNSKNSLPEKIKLDEDFGFFIGIFLAEGCYNGKRKNKILIANNDKRITDKIGNYIEREFGFKSRIDVQNNKNKEGWTSTTQIIDVSILAKLVYKMCGEYSDKKFVPPFAYNSNKKFIKGLLSGYISGDGYINKRCICRCVSVSKKLLKGIGLLLTRFGINYNIVKPNKCTSNNLGTLAENIKQRYELNLNSSGTIKLLNEIKIYKNYKDDRILKYKNKISKYSFKYNDIIPNVQIEDKIIDIIRDKLLNYTEEYPELKEVYNSNLHYEKIVNIEYVKPSNGYTYDITVDNDHTFVANSIIQSNTFHLSGVAAKSSVLSGIPRMEELFRVTKKIKTPMMDVFLDNSIMDNKYQAKIIANSIEHTTLSDFAKNIGIWFDPVANKTVVDEDKSFVDSYFKNTVGGTRINLDRLSKFMIRVELDKHKTIYKQMRMNYLKFQLEKYKNGYFYIVHSDDNADHLILHIRMNLDNVTTKYTDELDLVRKSRELIMDKIEIRGIKGVESAQIDNAGEKVYVYNLETGKREQKDQWIIYTNGTNLK
jgi:DNA-directed RNA polymerase beta' subunit